MKVVLDTNVLIAAFITRGVCNELFEHCILNHDLILSDFIIKEFGDKLKNKFGFTSVEIDSAVTLFKSRCKIVSTKKFLEQICRDPDDDNILAVAASESCSCIVTGDKDLLILKKYLNIPIILPSQFWNFEDLIENS